VPAVLLTAVATVASLRVASTHANAQRGLDERFHARTENGAEFLASYTADLIARERAQAERLLADERIDRRAFTQVAAAFEFTAAVLLDSEGRVLHVLPHNPAVVGRPLPRTYAYLEAALRGDAAASGVVPSAAADLPVIAVATPFETPWGRRVFSGAYNAGSTPVARFLANAVPIDGADSWLVDQHQQVVASNRSAAATPSSLAAGDAVLARASLVTTGSSYRRGGEKRHYAGVPVPGTPWTLVQSVPEQALYAPIGDGTAARLTIAALCAMTLFTFALFGRLARKERRLAEAVRTDVLTGMHNRRSVEEHLARATASSRRSGRPTAVLIIDVDHFKRVNDSHGHHAGDVVLQAVGTRVASVLRENEIVGRWGGEEFVALLPETAEGDAALAAERVRAAVCASPVRMRGITVTPTVSVGFAASASLDGHELVQRADDGLYRAKEAGRNRVATATAVDLSTAPQPVLSRR
jgi:diguanylate cyclase (GGDEF)-like protein